ncbi:hypothetical protein GQ457_05G034840 [Hibiscus cannabinus]
MEAREGAISLFVENLPENLHWKGLWFAFARHGEVVNVYIARKRSRWGKRFGFVRMKNLEEADRVTQRLNGATLYGSRLVVKIARDNDGQGWKRNTTCRSQFTEYKKTGIGLDDEAIVQKVRTRVSIEEDIGKEKFKRIIGYVENEDLWNLRRCLVGVMDMVCSVSSIHSRLLKWGLGDINVQRLGAKMYLLTITDEELSQMLEDGKIGMGFIVKAQEFKSSWANVLDETLNSGMGFNLNNRGKALSDGENEKDFFNDLEARKGKKRGKGTKKFGSLLELQNISITASERRKRDKALRSRKWNKQFLKETELSGKSLSDSDIKSRVSVLVKEAKHVLNLGPSIGPKSISFGVTAVSW